jgi:hypothetical protein
MLFRQSALENRLAECILTFLRYLSRPHGHLLLPKHCLSSKDDFSICVVVKVRKKAAEASGGEEDAQTWGKGERYGSLHLGVVLSLKLVVLRRKIRQSKPKLASRVIAMGLPPWAYRMRRTRECQFFLCLAPFFSRRNPCRAHAAMNRYKRD